MHTTTASAPPELNARWSTSGRLLEALTRRDFAALAGCLAPGARLRAVTPGGDLDLTGPDLIGQRFGMWFGDAVEFEVVDAALGELGSRLYFRWRIRTSGRRGGTTPPEVVEQHVFATVGEQIESLDLLCSGFHPLPTGDGA